MAEGDKIKIKTYSLILFVGTAIILSGYLTLRVIQHGGHVTDIAPAGPRTGTAKSGCGQAALMTIAQRHGEETMAKLSSLLAQEQSVKGTAANFYNLRNWAKAAGMKPIGLEVDSRYLDELPLPAIVHLHEEHFWVLNAVDENQVEIIDQGVSKHQLSLEDFNRVFSGHVLCFQ